MGFRHHFFIPLLSGMIFSNSIIVEFINSIFINYNLFFKVTIITILSYFFLLLSFIIKLYLLKQITLRILKYQSKYLRYCVWFQQVLLYYFQHSLYYLST